MKIMDKITSSHTRIDASCSHGTLILISVFVCHIHSLHRVKHLIFRSIKSFSIQCSLFLLPWNQRNSADQSLSSIFLCCLIWKDLKGEFFLLRLGQDHLLCRTNKLCHLLRSGNEGRRVTLTCEYTHVRTSLKGPMDHLLQALFFFFYHISHIKV